MAISFRRLHPSFVAEVSPVDLRGVDDEPTLAQIRAGMDALPAATKAAIEGLRVHHSIAHSRQLLGFEFSRDDNRATMHRARPFDDGAHRRELRRVTTLDVERALAASGT